MMQNFVKFTTFMLVAMLLTSFLMQSEATYRKPPFNGSIFGKRTSTNEYDGTGKTLSAMCEIASEACQAWFPAPEN